MSNETNAIPTGEAQTAQAETPTLKLKDVKKAYFTSLQVADAEAYIQSAIGAAQAENGLVRLNFNAENELPEKYGIVVSPINQRSNGETSVVGVAVGAIPDYELLTEETAGAEWAQQQVINTLCAKFINAVRPKDSDNEPLIPFEVGDFITSHRAEGVLVAYREYSGQVIKLLKSRGLMFINDQILRQILQSTAFAEQQFPNIDQAQWVKLLDAMIAQAEQSGLAPGVLTEWKDNRDKAGLPEIKDFDFSDLDFSASATAE